MSAGRPRLEVVVDELVLRGVPPEHAQVMVAALEARLTLLGQEHARSGAPLPARAEAARRLPAVQAPAASPAALGDAVAGAVWSALAPGGQP